MGGQEIWQKNEGFAGLYFDRHFGCARQGSSESIGLERSDELSLFPCLVYIWTGKMDNVVYC